MDRYEVVVIGAGLAGLCATRDLLAAGLDVLLLEARDRVGGRTWSVPFDSAGCTVDLGAEWVAPEHHDNVVDELSRYGLALERPSEPQVSSLPCFDQIQWFMKLCDDAAADIDIGKPGWYLGHAQYDVTVSQFLDQHGISEEAAEGFLAHSFALQGASPDRYSFLNLCHEFAAFGSVEAAFTAAECRIAGGSQRLSVALASDVQQVLRLAWPITGIAQQETGIAVEGPKGVISAENVVIALPVNVLGDLELDFSIPAAARRLIEQRHVGSAAKGWAMAEMRASIESIGWPFAVEVYSRAGSFGDVVCTFAVAEPDHPEALARSWEEVARRHRETALLENFLSHDWITDPYARGTWLSCAPGQLAGAHDLADMPPPCLFAGGDISRGWYGWMEGAVTSGRDAAQRLIAFLSEGHCPSAAG
ncbi:MAG: NAD(P)/FAD-dependent oxidoreductase [Halieaceae bacterium]